MRSSGWTGRDERPAQFSAGRVSATAASARHHWRRSGAGSRTRTGWAPRCCSRHGRGVPGERPRRSPHEGDLAARSTVIRVPAMFGSEGTKGRVSTCSFDIPMIILHAFSALFATSYRSWPCRDRNPLLEFEFESRVRKRARVQASRSVEGTRKYSLLAASPPALLPPVVSACAAHAAASRPSSMWTRRGVV